MHRYLSGLIAAIVLAAGFVMVPAPAQAARVSQDCIGGYLVGFETRRGVWLDRIAAICQPWNRVTLSLDGDDTRTPLGTSRGGSPQTLRCEAGFAIVDLDQFSPTISGKPVSQSVTLTCQRVKWPHNGSTRPQPVLATTGDHRSDNDSCGFPPGVCASGTHMPMQSCDTGTIATGYDAQVNAGIGEIRLHCGPWPSEKVHLPHPTGGSSGGGVGSSTDAASGFAGHWRMHLSDGYTYDMNLFSFPGGLVTGSYDTGRRNGAITRGHMAGEFLNVTWSQSGTIKGVGTGTFHLSDANHITGTWIFGAATGSWFGERIP